MTPEREREIRDVQTRMEARAPSMGLHAAAARMPLSMSRDLLAEVDRLRALIASAGAVISEIGCECACDHSTEEDHDDDCDPCAVCRLAGALQPEYRR